jgi:hypothetical protein
LEHRVREPLAKTADVGCAEAVGVRAVGSAAPATPERFEDDGGFPNPPWPRDEDVLTIFEPLTKAPQVRLAPDEIGRRDRPADGEVGRRGYVRAKALHFARSYNGCSKKILRMHTERPCEDAGVIPGVLGAVVAVVLAAVFGWLARPLPPDPRRRAALAEAIEAVDRELAANIELMSMFDQTRQAVVLENGEFIRHRAILESDASPAAGGVADLYGRMADTESAMERRGPSNTLKEEDRRLIEAWEGDAREAQRALRRALAQPPPRGWAAAIARLRGRWPPQ